MMLKKKSNNWARLKLALLVPVGFAALSAFARPETSPPPAATMTDNIHLSINKSTVNQETMQQDHAVFLTYKESGSEDLNSNVCRTLDRIRTRVAEGQFKNALEVTVNPAFDDIPASYLETVKDVLEERDIKCKIDMTVPNTIMDDVAKPYRKYDDVVYLIQNKKIVAALSISKFSANQNDPRLDKISKSASLILQPENPKVSRQEMEKLKNLLDKKGLTSEINMNIQDRRCCGSTSPTSCRTGYFQLPGRAAGPTVRFIRSPCQTGSQSRTTHRQDLQGQYYESKYKD